MVNARIVRHVRRITFFVGFIVLAMALAWTADANPHGWVGATETGCTCHAPAPASDVVVSVRHLPENYTPKKTYELMVTVEGGPAIDLSQGGHAGGFDLRATSGNLRVPRGSLDVLESEPGALLHDMTATGHDDRPFGPETYGELTFTHEGANLREWTVEWVAPSSGKGDVRFFVAGLSANGDHRNSPDDGWNRTSYVVPEGASVDAAGTPVWLWAALVLGAAVIGVGSWTAVARSQRKRRARPNDSSRAIVTCPDCGSDVRASHLIAHRKRVH